MDEAPEDDVPGIPAWVVTFADLMSLLMCFFVLLLSFSEIDASKFKQIADELSKAFGVQRDVAALDIPMGTSPIFDHFSPAKPEPTVLNEIRQSTSKRDPNIETNTTQNTVNLQQTQAIKTQVNEATQELRKVLEEQLKDGRIDLSERDSQIVIRIEEKGSFPSGSAKLTYPFEELLYGMAKVLKKVPGNLTVEGHTDNIPISSSRYASNWNLSADRAAAVANALIQAGDLNPTRFSVMGFAETQPRVENDTVENRAQNRRVEIIVDLAKTSQETHMELRELIDSPNSELRKSMGTDEPQILPATDDNESGAGQNITW